MPAHGRTAVGCAVALSVAIADELAGTGTERDPRTVLRTVGQPPRHDPQE